MSKTTIIAALTLAVLISEASAQSRSNGDLIRVIKNSESATIKTDRGDAATWAEARSYYDDFGMTPRANRGRGRQASQWDHLSRARRSEL